MKALFCFSWICFLAGGIAMMLNSVALVSACLFGLWALATILCGIMYLIPAKAEPAKHEDLATKGSASLY